MILWVSYLFSPVYLGINAALLLVSGVLSPSVRGDNVDTVLRLARVLRRWHDSDPPACRRFCHKERPALETLHDALFDSPLGQIPRPSLRPKPQAPPEQPGAKVYYVRAGAYLQTGEVDKAIADCTQAIRMNPEYAEAYCRRGNAYRQGGNFYKAFADLVEAIRLKPDLAEAYYVRACTYLQTGGIPQGNRRIYNAIADLTEAIRLNPEYAEAYCRPGRCLSANRRAPQGPCRLQPGHATQPDVCQTVLQPGHGVSREKRPLPVQSAFLTRLRNSR